mmetsp:Transcript_38796/g.93777  ORF Transcript_38796/g.93777 Transcript_38796/m.93777 type:complete len:207 (-) Transcript_38796:888-1508(-)
MRGRHTWNFRRIGRGHFARCCTRTRNCRQLRGCHTWEFGRSNGWFLTGTWGGTGLYGSNSWHLRWVQRWSFTETWSATSTRSRGWRFTETWSAASTWIRGWSKAWNTAGKKACKLCRGRTAWIGTWFDRRHHGWLYRRPCRRTFAHGWSATSTRVRGRLDTMARLIRDTWCMAWEYRGLTARIATREPACVWCPTWCPTYTWSPTW